MAGFGDYQQVATARKGADEAADRSAGRNGTSANGTGSNGTGANGTSANGSGGDYGGYHGFASQATARRLGGAAFDGDAQRRARLARTIEGEIIPRLKLAHGLAQPCQNPAPSGNARIGPDDVFAFARLVLRTDVGTALAHIEVMRTQVPALDTIFLDLLAPSARLLGDLWLADECSFIDVTIGLARLQQIVRELTPDFEPDLTDEAHPGRRALIVPAPGEQHTFGCFLVEHFFRRAGWEVAAPPQGPNALMGAVRNEWFGLVGISASCVELMDGLQSTIRSLRHASANPNLIVMVGGPAFQENSKLVSQVGADAVAGDARHAVLAADGLLESSKTAPALRARGKASWKRNGAAGLTRNGTPV